MSSPDLGALKVALEEQWQRVQEISQWLDDRFAEIDAQLDAGEQRLSTLHQELEDGAKAHSDALAGTVEPIEELCKTVLEDEHLGALDKLSDAPADLAVAIDDLGAESENLTDSTVEELRGFLSETRELAEGFTEQAEAFCQEIAGAAESVQSGMEEAGGQLGDQLEELGELSKGLNGEAVEQLIEKMGDEITKVLGDATGGLMDGIEVFDGASMEFVDQLTSNLEGVTDTLDEVHQVVEPLEPILSTVSGMV